MVWRSLFNIVFTGKNNRWLVWECNLEKKIQSSTKSIALNEKYEITKNTLIGPTNCKKTTRHHTHLSLCAKSRKNNNAKSRKWPKTSISAIFLTISRSNISKLEVFLKNRFHSTWRSYLVLTSGQKLKKSLKPFLRKYQSVWFWENLDSFSRISLNQDFFFQKSGSVTFLPL